MRESLLFFVLSYSLINTAQESTRNWDFTSTNSVSYFTGNIDKFDARSSSELSHVDSTYEFSVGYLFHYGELRDNKYLVLHQGSVYYDFSPYDRISPFANITLLSNEYKGFDMRLTSVVGAKYIIYRTDSHLWSISAGILHDYSDFADLLKGDEPTKASSEVIRLSIRPKIRVRLGEQSMFKHFTFYQPSMTEVEDYLILSQSNFEIEVVDHISLSIGYFFNINSRPAYERIRSQDERLLLGVKLEI